MTTEGTPEPTRLIDQIRAHYPKLSAAATDCQIVDVFSRRRDIPPSIVAMRLGLDAADYADGADCRPEAVKLATDPLLWGGVAVLVVGILLYRRFQGVLMAILDDIKHLPAYKKAIGVGAVLFLVACLFPPFQATSPWGTSSARAPYADGFNFIFGLPNDGLAYEVAWSILSVELVAILAVTLVAVFLLKKG